MILYSLRIPLKVWTVICTALQAFVSYFTGCVSAIPASECIVVRITNFTGFAAKWHAAVSGGKCPAAAHTCFYDIMSHIVPPILLLLYKCGYNQLNCDKNMIK